MQSGGKVEVSFFANNSRKPLLNAFFPDKPTALTCIEKLRRRLKREYFKIVIDGDSFYFSVRDRHDTLLCRSHDYTKKQDAELGIQVVIQDFAIAKTRSFIEEMDSKT
jgi:hypothetical protein